MPSLLPLFGFEPPDARLFDMLGIPLVGSNRGQCRTATPNAEYREVDGSGAKIIDFRRISYA
jgi:hypothetical protein